VTPTSFDLNSKIGRWVGFFLLPLCTGLATLVAVKAKAWFGVEVDTTEAAAFIFSVAAGILTWLFNRGKYEVAHVLNSTPPEVSERLHDLEALLPAPPQAAKPGAGSPASPRAPGSGGVSPALGG
jgi:hypothetical protein